MIRIKINQELSLRLKKRDDEYLFYLISALIIIFLGVFINILTMSYNFGISAKNLITDEISFELNNFINIELARSG